jgi:hypothetical protein
MAAPPAKSRVEVIAPMDLGVVQLPVHSKPTTAHPMIAPHNPASRIDANATTRAVTDGSDDNPGCESLTGDDEIDGEEGDEAGPAMA